MPRKNPTPGQRRKATILLVVVVLCTLFLVIGLCFVLFAEAQATSSRIYREANNNIADKYPTAEEMFAFALGEVIYDVPDDTGAYSALRGYGLARNMYGWNSLPPGAPGNSSTDMIGLNNETPFNGAGRLHTPANNLYMNTYGVDDVNLLNYQYFAA